MKKLYLIKLLIKDVFYSKITYVTIFFIIAFVNCISIIANVCSNSFSKSINNVANRLGADIVIVSNEYDSSFQDMLFMGYPSTLIFEADFYDELQKCSCVKDITKQLFLSSLSSSCCESEVQFIVYDEDTDTLVNSLIDKYVPENENRDIIIGSNIQYEIGDKAKFFECIFRVAGKLTSTGMGYDDCIFINKKVGESVLNFLRIESDYYKVSMIMININENISLSDAYDEISSVVSNRNVAVYKTKEIFSELSSKVKLFSTTSRFFVVILEVISCVALFAIFTLSVEIRKSSIDALNIIGVSNRDKAILILSEGAIISFISALTGELFGLLMIVLIKNTIEVALGLPIILSERVFGTMLIAVCISIIISIVANVYSAYLTFERENKGNY